MKNKMVSEICAKRRRKYDPSCPTAFDDIAVINQLFMDLLWLQMKVKVWEDEHELVIPIGKKEEKAVDNGSEKLEQSGSKYVDQEAVQDLSFSAHEPISKIPTVIVADTLSDATAPSTSFPEQETMQYPPKTSLPHIVQS